MDDRKIKRRICVSTWQTAKNKKNLRVVHLKFPSFWDYIHINLAEVTAALFGTNYVETVGIKVSVGGPDGPRQRWHLFTCSPVPFFPADSCKLSNPECVFLRQTVL